MDPGNVQDNRVKTRQEIVEGPEGVRDPKSQALRASKSAILQRKRRSARSAALANHLPPIKPRDHGHSGHQSAVVRREMPRPVGKLGGAKVSFEVQPTPSVPLLTYESLAAIVLRTGRIRYKMAIAKTDSK
jgi:hypothetical protein